MEEIDEDHVDKTAEFTTLIAEGEWLLTKREYKNAEKNFTTALDLKPGDRKGFVARCKCYLKMGDLENALKDAESALEEDETFYEGLFLKAEALFYQGEFEFALMFYDRGQRVRPHFEGFRLGIQKSQEAIEKSTSGRLTIKPGGKEGRLSPRDEEEFFLKGGKINPMKYLKSEETSRQPQLFNQKKFLEDLIHDKDFSKSRTRRGEKLQDILECGLKSLDICVTAFNPVKASAAPKRKVRASNKRHRGSIDPVQLLLQTFQDIDTDLTDGNPEEAGKKAEGVLNVLQKWSEKDVPEKKELLGRLHGYIGIAAFEQGHLEIALEHHQKDLELSKECKQTEAVRRPLENLGRTFAKMGQFQMAIDCWTDAIDLIQDCLEKAWLLHELGCCHMELRHFEDARLFGEKAVAEATEADDKKWMMYTNTLLGQSELSLGDFHWSVSHFEEALIQATALQDLPSMKTIRKVLDKVNNILDH